jgi:hypothetical protein
MRMRSWAIAIGITITAFATTPAIADTCESNDPPVTEGATEIRVEIDPPESAGCAVRPGVGALTSLGMSILALGLAARRRTVTR